MTIPHVDAGPINPDRHDGGLPPAVGVQSYQVLRARRSTGGWTYNHAPMLAYWNGTFYLEYLSNPVSEHVPPGRTLLTRSNDGIHWSDPVVVFPPYDHEQAAMHQRMGFYLAPNGRMLVCGFYGLCPSPQDGRGIGRVIREIRADGEFGDIYFVRYNRHARWHEHNTDYPFYLSCADSGLIEACEALLADRLVTMQWWEEDRSDDGFYPVTGHEAPSIYRLPDDRAVVVWKLAHAAISADGGTTWSDPARIPGMITAGGKAWAQRTADGRYALAYNPMPINATRWPLAVVTGDDGLAFSHMVCVDGNVPPRRYIGQHKDFGPSYVRGIEAGADVPDGAMWLTYSTNKEDIWVSRVPVPIVDRVTGPVDDRFDDFPVGGIVRDWNIHSGQWTSVAVEAGRGLVLRDRDPYAQARAERVFPESRNVVVECRLATRAPRGELHIEVCERKGAFPIRLVLDGAGTLSHFHYGSLKPICRSSDEWLDLRIVLDVERHVCTVDAGNAHAEMVFMVPVDSVERLVFRTGPLWREPTYETPMESPDLPGADEPTEEAVFAISRVSIR
jgi:hypothetical protein